MKPSTIADEFTHITEQMTKILQSHDPKLLVKQCGTIMAIASDHVYNVKLFSDDQITKLKNYNNTNVSLLLQELSHLWSWSNHSVLRVLVGFCDEAIKLLDEFDCHLDPFEPIASYPVLEIKPTNVTTQAVLKVKFAKDISTLVLQDVFNMCSLVMSKCDVTQYCPQLLATEQIQGFITIYWSIPKCVVNVIGSKVLQHSNNFYEIGVLEVQIYPDIHIFTNFNVSLAILVSLL